MSEILVGIVAQLELFKVDEPIKSLLYTASQSNSSKSNTGQSTTADTGT